MRGHKDLFAAARRAGLGVTVHTGEEDQLDEMRYVVKEIRPDRIGHGVQCAGDEQLMRLVAKRDITLEVCPTSNFRNSVLKDAAAMREVFDGLLRHGVKFVICTDGPEMYQTHLYQEQDFLVKNGILTRHEIDRAEKRAFAASFIA